MSDTNNQSADEFSDHLRRMATPSIVECSEELFYQIGWAASIADRTTTTRGKATTLRPFAIGLVTGIAATFALTLNIWQPILETDTKSQMIASDKTSNRNDSNDGKLETHATFRPFDDTESLIALIPLCASHGLSRVTQDVSVIRNSEDGELFPKKQSSQTFRHELMKEMNL